MIQRIQTLWLLLSSTLCLLTFVWPLYLANAPQAFAFKATERIPLLFLLSSVATLSLVSVFLYANRRFQMKLIIATLLVNIAAVAACWLYIKQFQNSNQVTEGYWYVGAVCPLLSVIALVLALRGVYRDEKLIKSLNRMR